MATIYVPRQENPWVKALQNVAMMYLGNQVNQGMERTRQADNFTAQKAIYDAMQTPEQAAGSPAPTMYDLAPAAVASRATQSMTGTGTPYTPPPPTPEEMYGALIRPREPAAIPTREDLINRGLKTKNAAKVGFENVVKIADGVNAGYEPRRKAQAQAQEEEEIRSLIPGGGDLRNDPNTLAQVGSILQARGYDPEKVFKFAFANKSFEKLDLDDRVDAGAFDPVTGKTQMSTYKKGVNPTDLMKERAATGRTAMTQQGENARKWQLEKGADGVLYRVNPLSGESVPMKGVKLPQNSNPAEWELKQNKDGKYVTVNKVTGKSNSTDVEAYNEKKENWTTFTDVNGVQHRIEMSSGKTEPTGLRGTPESDPERKEASETLFSIGKFYPYGFDETTPKEILDAANSAMGVLTRKRADKSGGFRFTPEQRETLLKTGYSEEQVNQEEARRGQK